MFLKLTNKGTQYILNTPVNHLTTPPALALSLPRPYIENVIVDLAEEERLVIGILKSPINHLTTPPALALSLPPNHTPSTSIELAN